MDAATLSPKLHGSWCWAAQPEILVKLSVSRQGLLGNPPLASTCEIWWFPSYETGRSLPIFHCLPCFMTISAKSHIYLIWSSHHVSIFGLYSPFNPLAKPHEIKTPWNHPSAAAQVQACCFSKQLQRGLKTLEEMMDRKANSVAVPNAKVWVNYNDLNQRPYHRWWLVRWIIPFYGRAFQASEIC